ncbi:MAG: outer membrane beta-barrel protein [Bacteroidales bacterium]
MKKIYTIVFLALICGFTVKAQHYDLGYMNLSAGTGVVSSLQGDTKMPNTSLSFEYGITENIGLALNIEYASSQDITNDYSGKQYSWDYTYLSPSLTGHYHFASAMNYSIYGALTLGYSKVDSEYSSIDDVEQRDPKESNGLCYGAHIGGRYYLNDVIGIYTEAGYGSLSIINMGLSLRFNHR